MERKYNIKPLLYVITGIIILFIISITVFTVYKIQNREKPLDIEYVDTNHIYHKVYDRNSDSDFKNLQKQNKILYDSLKKQQKQINELIYFKYHKTYKITNTVRHDTVKNTKVNTYTYSSLPNDSLDYTLSITSQTQPISYSLNVTAKDKILLVDKKESSDNHLTIQTSNKANISNVVTYSKKNKQHKLFISPTVGLGYGILNKQPDVFVGVGLSYKF